ncbi:MAG: hypothetical protein Q9218_003813 [Villophora microphyllina]
MASKPEPPREGFLRFPPEIRQMFYDKVFDHSKVTVIWKYDSELKKYVFITHQAQGLLYTCRIIRDEVTPTFYAKTHFVLDVGIKPIYGINTFIRLIGNGNANLITKLTLLLVDGCLCEENSSLAKNPLKRLEGWVRQFPRLQELRLRYPFDINPRYLHIEQYISDVHTRHGSILDKMLVLVEGKHTTVVVDCQGGRHLPRRIYGGKVTKRLSLAHNCLCIEPFMEEVGSDDRDLPVRYTATNDAAETLTCGHLPGAVRRQPRQMYRQQGLAGSS